MWAFDQSTPMFQFLKGFALCFKNYELTPPRWFFLFSVHSSLLLGSLPLLQAYYSSPWCPGGELLGGALYWLLYHLSTITASRHLLCFVYKSVRSPDCYSAFIASWGPSCFSTEIYSNKYTREHETMGAREYDGSTMATEKG